MARVCVVQINVSDMDRAIEFYSDILGFEIQSREHYPQIVKLENETVPLLLFKVSQNSKIGYPDAALTMINIETEDLAAALMRFEEHGVEVLHDEPETCPVGIYAAIRDPFGNVIELVEYQH